MLVQKIREELLGNSARAVDIVYEEFDRSQKGATMVSDERNNEAGRFVALTTTKVELFRLRKLMHEAAIRRGVADSTDGIYNRRVQNLEKQIQDLRRELLERAQAHEEAVVKLVLFRLLNDFPTQ